jgi:hypothetical protein
VFVDCRHNKKVLAQMSKLLSLNINFCSDITSKCSEIPSTLGKGQWQQREKQSGGKLERFF